MDFSLTAEQAQFQESVRRFAARELASGALTRAHTEGYPWDIAAKTAAQGLLGIALPEADGGQGGSLMDAVIAIEEVALACPRSADCDPSRQFRCHPHLRGIRQPQSRKRASCRHLLAGKAVIALGMSEPEAGSAVTDLRHGDA